VDVNPYAPPAATEDAHGARATFIVPFAFGPTLGQSFSLYFKNLPIIAGVTLVVFFPIELVKGYALHASAVAANTLVDVYADAVLENIFGSLVAAALIPALVHNIDTGGSLGVGSALSAGLRRWGAVFGARFIAGLRIVIFLILLVIPGIVVGVRLSLTDEIAVLEDARSVGSILRRSEDLVRGHGWGIFGVALVGFGATFVTGFMGGMVTGFIKSWLASTVADCVNVLAHGLFSVMFLVTYLGLTRAAVPVGVEGAA
jgi:hypothetical protein